MITQDHCDHGNVLGSICDHCVRTMDTDNFDWACTCGHDRGEHAASCAGIPCAFCGCKKFQTNHLTRDQELEAAARDLVAFCENGSIEGGNSALNIPDFRVPSPLGSCPATTFMPFKERVARLCRILDAGPVAEKMRKKIEKLEEENRMIREKVEELSTSLGVT